MMNRSACISVGSRSSLGSSLDGARDACGMGRWPKGYRICRGYIYIYGYRTYEGKLHMDIIWYHLISLDIYIYIYPGYVQALPYGPWFCCWSKQLSPFVRKTFLKINAVVRNCQPIWSGIFAVWSGIFAAEKRAWHGLAAIYRKKLCCAQKSCSCAKSIYWAKGRN